MHDGLSGNAFGIGEYLAGGIAEIERRRTHAADLAHEDRIRR